MSIDTRFTFSLFRCSSHWAGLQLDKDGNLWSNRSGPNFKKLKPKYSKDGMPQWRMTSLYDKNRIKTFSLEMINEHTTTRCNPSYATWLKVEHNVSFEDVLRNHMQNMIESPVEPEQEDTTPGWAPKPLPQDVRFLVFEEGDNCAFPINFKTYPEAEKFAREELMKNNKLVLEICETRKCSRMSLQPAIVLKKTSYFT